MHLQQARLLLWCACVCVLVSSHRPGYTPLSVSRRRRLTEGFDAAREQFLALAGVQQETRQSHEEAEAQEAAKMEEGGGFFIPFN